MTPKEIQKIMHQSLALQEALKAHPKHVYCFLREQVTARYGYFPQEAHHCERCGVITYPTLKSPYNCFHPGWCIDCVLQGFFTPDTPLYVPFQPPVPTKEQIDRLIAYKRSHPRPRTSW